METLEAEATAPTTADDVEAVRRLVDDPKYGAADDVEAVRRLVDDPKYGAAAWAVVYGNGKYVGTMPSE
eukprot:1319829-Pleurochrysis_carterae.AAC.1